MGVVRKFRNATYNITVQNPEHINQGIAWIKVDGQLIEGDILPIIAADAECSVEVMMG